MSKVSLTLTGVKANTVEKETRKAMAELYSKPESHFDIHCQHLFELKKPYKLINQIDAGEAELHREKLEQMGIVCEVVPLNNSGGLSLVPVDAKEVDDTNLCPACDQPSYDPEVCDSCGVIMSKFAEQRKIDEMLQKKLASADRSHDRIKEAQQLEDERRKKVKIKTPQPAAEPEIASDDEQENRFTVVVEDEGKNKILYIAAACAFIVAIGGGYFAYSLNKASQAKEVVFSLASLATPSAKEVNDQTHVVAPEEGKVGSEATPYSEWRDRMASIDELKHQLGALNEAVGMTSTMSGLLANVEYPMDRIVANHHAVNLKFKKLSLTTVSDDPDPVLLELESELDNSLLLIAALPSAVERMCALLDLGKTLESLNLPRKADLAYQRAEKTALEAMNSKDQSEVVLAETIAAEHLFDTERHDQGRTHYASAIDAARLDELNSNWAMAFVVESQASRGLFADAYSLVETIPDERTKTVAMERVARIAEQLELDQDVMDLDAVESGIDGSTSNEIEFADDPALMLLFENDKKMKENAKKISNLVDR